MNVLIPAFLSEIVHVSRVFSLLVHLFKYFFSFLSHNSKFKREM